jgi:anti-anti-sigma factor
VFVSLTIETLDVSGVTIIAVRGSMTLGPALMQFAAKARALLESVPAALILDVGGVGALDSAGLGELIKVYSSAARRGVAFALSAPSPRLREVMAMTHVDEILECYSDRQSALARFNQRG